MLEVATGAWVRPPVIGHKGSVWMVDFAPDGSTFVSAGGDGRVGLWDAATGDLVGTVTPGRPEVSVFPSYLPNGHTVLIGSADGTFYAWDIRSRRWVDFACSVARRELTGVEWTDAFPNRPYRRTCRQPM